MGFAVLAPLKYTYASGYVSITANNVNIRNGAGLNYKVVASAGKNDRVVWLDYSKGWYRIKLSNGVQGWIYGKYVKVQNVAENVSREGAGKRAFISADQVNMRNDSSMKAKITAVLRKGQAVLVKGQRNGWFNVVLGDGRSGWVYGDYVSTGMETVSRGSTARIDGQRIVEYAKTFLGTRYVYGGASPAGFDCSGFTSYVYRHFGISLPRTADEQGSHGIYVSRDNLAPGDLVFFATSGGRSITHAGIYIGNNSFIHSSSARRGVIISELSDYYDRAYVTARRYLQY